MYLPVTNFFCHTGYYCPASTTANALLFFCHTDGNEGPARVAALLRQNPPAGKAFCTSLCQAVPAQQIAELIAALRDHLLSSAPPAAAEHGGTNSAAVAAASAAAAAVASKGSKRRRGRKGSADAQASEVLQDLGW